MDNLTATKTHGQGNPIKHGVYTAVAGAVLVLISFTTAWITFSGKKVDSQTISGFGMSNQLSGIGKLAPYFLIFLAVITLGVAALAWKQKLSPTLDGFSFITGGALGLFILFWQVSAVQRQIIDADYSTTRYQVGLWGLILGFFLVLLGGIMILREVSVPFHNASGRAILYAILILGAIIAIYPFFWMISTSLMTLGETILKKSL